VRKKTKFLILRTIIVLVFGILAGRLWYVQVVMGSYYKAQADTSKIRLEPVQALRGIIYDSKGRQLVWNAPSWNAEIVPHGIPAGQAHAIYSLLSKLLGGNPSPSKIASIVKQNEWQPYAPAVVKQQISSSQAMLIMQLHTRLPGVRADPTTIRKYNLDPTMSLSHILGYTGIIGQQQFSDMRRLYPQEHITSLDQVGQQGIESVMEPYLHGSNGTEKVEVDAGERPVRTLSTGTFVSGDSVYLTVDSRLQRQVGSDLAAALNHVNLRRGAAVVEDVHTGKILAMVSLPSFNDNWFSPSISVKRYAALSNDPAKPLTDGAYQGVYPPGSIFKVITAAAALQTGVATGSRVIEDNGSICLRSIYDPSVCSLFRGWTYPQGLGLENVVRALAQSSDIYFYTVAGGNPNVDPKMPYIGANRLHYWATQFGLGSQLGIELPGEAPGFIPSATWFDKLKPAPNVKNPGDVWHIGNTYNMAIGQGQNLVTPLQMANVAATIANGGTLYRPRIVDHIAGRITPRKGVSRKSHTILPFVPQIIRRGFIDPGNLALIQEGMHESVTLPGWQGTSYYVKDPRIDAAGKTGTSEAPGGANAWWIGYAPFNNPKIAVAVVVPNASSEGAYTAAPIAHKIFEDYFHLKPTKPDWLTDVSRQLTSENSSA
jgi:penicillin-binding protein 2